jgi:DNA topoisomerase I
LDTSKSPDATNGAASSIAITPDGGSSATAKYGKMLMFARVLPSTRARVGADLRRQSLPSERVVAAVVRLLELTLFRIGNSEYARTNGSFGLKTLRDRHAQIEESHVHLSFRGRSGSRNETDINDAGERHTVTSTEVNAYLHEITGEEITAKDFRTWAGTNLAALALREFEHIESDAMRKRAIVRAVERVAKHLGNTPAVCRRCYIHPEIFVGWDTARHSGRKNSRLFWRRRSRA